jgi:hypothetical protein
MDPDFVENDKKREKRVGIDENFLWRLEEIVHGFSCCFCQEEYFVI